MPGWTEPTASAQMLLVATSPCGGGIESAGLFVNRCVVHGIDLYFEVDDTLPTRVPPGIQSVMAVVIDVSLVEANRETLRRYEHAGARIYLMADTDPATPNATLNWTGLLTLHLITIDAGLTPRHPAMRRRMIGRDEHQLFNDLSERLLKRESTRWYDATRYQWEAMLDGHELTGDQRYLDTARKQMRHMVDHVPNDLSNCDTVSPLDPMLRLYQCTGEPWLLDTARKMFDRYLQCVPRWRGVFVNFEVYANHARSEIVWQVLPGLMRLARVTGEPKYAEVVFDQYEKIHGMLFDTEQGLWHHGVGVAGRTEGFWARGVAFTMFGSLLLLELTEADDPRRDLLHDAVTASVERLAQLQDVEGFWHCVVDKPWTQPESSGTAWIGAAVRRGIRLGLVDGRHQPVADLAWDAVKTRIWRGDFPGHMTATTTTHIPGYYHTRQLSDTGWAHFAFRAACECRRASGA